MSDVVRILAVLALVSANAFFVIAEYALVTARRAALAPRAEEGSGIEAAPSVSSTWAKLPLTTPLFHGPSRNMPASPAAHRARPCRASREDEAG